MNLLAEGFIPDADGLRPTTFEVSADCLSAASASGGMAFKRGTSSSKEDTADKGMWGLEGRTVGDDGETAGSCGGDIGASDSCDGSSTGCASLPEDSDVGAEGGWGESGGETGTDGFPRALDNELNQDDLWGGESASCGSGLVLKSEGAKGSGDRVDGDDVTVESSMFACMSCSGRGC